MKVCQECGEQFDPTKDLYITVHERKGPSRDFCSLACTTRYIEDAD